MVAGDHQKNRPPISLSGPYSSDTLTELFITIAFILVCKVDTQSICPSHSCPVVPPPFQIFSRVREYSASCCEYRECTKSIYYHPLTAPKEKFQRKPNRGMILNVHSKLQNSVLSRSSFTESLIFLVCDMTPWFVT